MRERELLRRTKFKFLLANQSGGISILISMTIMSIITLIAFSYVYSTSVTFAETHEKQMSLQAQYAAETGINDARTYVNEIARPLYGNVIRGTPQQISANTPPPLPPGTDLRLVDSITETSSAQKASVAISTDTNTIIAGQPNHNSRQGRLIVAEKSGSTWSTRSQAPPSINGTGVIRDFGKIVATIDDIVVVVATWQQNASTDCDSGYCYDVIYFYDISGNSWVLDSVNTTTVKGVKFYDNLLNLHHGDNLFSNRSRPFINSLALYSEGSNKIGVIIGEQVRGPYQGSALLHHLVRVDSSTHTWKNDVFWNTNNNPPPAKLHKSWKTYTKQNQTPSHNDVVGLTVSIANDLLVIGYVKRIPVIGEPNNVVRFLKLTFTNGEMTDFTRKGNATLLTDFSRNLGGVVKTAWFGTRSLDLYYDVAEAKYHLIVGDQGVNSQTGQIYRYIFEEGDLVTNGRINNLYPGYDDSLVISGFTTPQTGDRFGQSLDRKGNILVVTSYPGSNVKVHIFDFEAPQPVTPPTTPTVALYQNSDIDCVNENNIDPSLADLFTFKLNDEGTVGYTCLDVDFLPDNVYFSNVGTNRSLNLLVSTLTFDGTGYVQANMSDLQINWIHSNIDNINPIDFTSHTFPELPTDTAWQRSAPILRLQIIALDMEGFNRQSLIDNTRVVYLYPTNEYDTSGKILEVDYSQITNGDIVKASCSDSTGGCEVLVTNLPSVIDYPDSAVGDSDQLDFLVNILPLYSQDIQVELRGFENQGSQVCINNELATTNIAGDNLCRLFFKDIQAVIRATGYAAKNRVRIEERIPLRPMYETIDYGVYSATSICKVLLGDQDLFTKFENLQGSEHVHAELYRDINGNFIDRANCQVLP